VFSGNQEMSGDNDLHDKQSYQVIAEFDVPQLTGMLIKIFDRQTESFTD
jgi:hypothetical protein